MPRQRKSLAEHALSGSKPQYVEQEPSQFPAGRPKMPKDLPPVAQAEWKRLFKELAKRGTMTRVDSSAAEVYVRLFADWRAFEDELENNGRLIDETILDKDGNPHTRRIVNPAVKFAVQLGNAVRQYQKEFSATPASREKAKPAAPPEPKRKEKTSEEIAEEAFNDFMDRGKE